MTYVVRTEDLPRIGNTFRFEGYLHQDVGLSFFLVDTPPGGGPRLHRHPYEEVFVVEEGRAAFTVGPDTIEVPKGWIVIVPPRVPHKFVNSGTGSLRQIAIHASERMITEWLEE